MSNKHKPKLDLPMRKPEHHKEHTPNNHHKTHHTHPSQHVNHNTPVHHNVVKHHHKSIPMKPRELNFQSERDIAIDFASAVHKKFDTLIKATILFGSQAKHTATASSDIDIVVLVDDASINWDLELVAWYREELGRIIANKKYNRELHVNTIKLTSWWYDLLNGDPVVLNIIRSGEVLIDIAGFFKPLKVLLSQGKMHSTPEAVYTALQRAPSHLARSKYAELGAIEGVYWTMVDSAQAALMTAGQLPPSPEHLPIMLRDTFVDKRLIKQELVTWMRDVYALHKAIIHGQVTNLRGADIDLWQSRAESFMKSMTNLIDQLIESNKK